MLCISNDSEGEIYATVKPILVENESVLSGINNEVNAVIFNGDAVGEVILIGKGAGKMPTGSAVYGDILDIINKRFTKITTFNSEEVKIITTLEGECSAVLRIKNSDEQSVIKQCVKNFKFVQVLQEEVEEEIGILIKANSELDVDSFIEKLQESNYVKSIKKIIKL